VRAKTHEKGKLMNGLRRRSACAIGAAAALALVGIDAALAAAGAQPAAETAAVALYDGPDRAQRLRDGARREGSVTVYSSQPVEDMQAQAAVFEQRTGIRVRIWRGSGQNVLQRGLVEYRAGRHDVDLFEVTGVEIEALVREGMLQEVRSPALATLDPRAVPPSRAYAGTRFVTHVLAYNTAAVRRDELPQRWEDLADPRWRGRLGITVDSVEWFATIVTALGTERGLQLFRDIAANGVSLRQGHSVLSNLVAAGDVPLALTIYDYRVVQLRRAGAPVESFTLDPTPVHLGAVGLASRSPRPHAAILLYEFLLTEGQEIRAARGYAPTDRPPDQRRYPAARMIDFGEALDNAALWNERFRSIVMQGAR